MKKRINTKKGAAKSMKKRINTKKGLYAPLRATPAVGKYSKKKFFSAILLPHDMAKNK